MKRVPTDELEETREEWDDDIMFQGLLYKILNIQWMQVGVSWTRNWRMTGSSKLNCTYSWVTRISKLR